MTTIAARFTSPPDKSPIFLLKSRRPKEVSNCRIRCS